VCPLDLKSGFTPSIVIAFIGNWNGSQPDVDVKYTNRFYPTLTVHAVKGNYVNAMVQ